MPFVTSPIVIALMKVASALRADHANTCGLGEFC